MSGEHGAFSHRFGFRADEAPISVRQDAPQVLREGIVMLADNLGLSPLNARLEVCAVLLKRPDPSNWSAYPNVFDEVLWLVEDAPWYRVYDIAEGFYERLSSGAEPERAAKFEARLNELFREHGIGWEMKNGCIVARGSEVFGHSVEAAIQATEETGHSTAAGELHEALRDISRRPEPDVTGAIQHAMAALECVAREVSGSTSKTLGQLIPTA